MTAQKIDGEVSINGEHCYSGINPVIADFGFRLWRLDENNPSMVRTHGPHFNLSLPTPSVFQNVSREAFLASVKYTFAGPFLGATNELSGIPALHEGSKTRYVDTIEVEAVLYNQILSLVVAGIAKPVMPISGQAIGPNCLLEPQSFRIHCPIPIALIPSVFPGRAGFFLQKKLECESMQDYIEAIKYGPPKDIE